MNKVSDLTVVTTSYNDEKNIVKYLNEILGQTFQPGKILIVDGGSIDDSKKVVEDYAKKVTVEIEFLCGERLNIAQAFNKGIKEVETEYVLITCMGNSFPNNMIESLYQGIQCNDSDASFGILKGLDVNPFSMAYNRAFIGGSRGIPIMSNRCVMYKKSVFDCIGYFCENFIYAGEDAEFLDRFKKRGLKSTFVNCPTVYWETPRNMSDNCKKQKFYCIAELQWFKSLLPIFFNIKSLYCYFLLLGFILAFWNNYFLLLFFMYIIVGYIILGCHTKSISLKVNTLLLFQLFSRIFYSIRYLKYRSIRYRAFPPYYLEK